jgi:hypothetical protein
MVQLAGSDVAYGSAERLPFGDAAFTVTGR